MEEVGELMRVYTDSRLHVTQLYISNVQVCLSVTDIRDVTCTRTTASFSYYNTRTISRRVLIDF